MSESRVINLSAVVSMDRGNHFALVDKVLEEFSAAMIKTAPHGGIHISMSTHMVVDEEEDDDRRD